MKYSVSWLARKKSSLLLQIVVQMQYSLSGILKMARLDICQHCFHLEVSELCGMGHMYDTPFPFGNGWILNGFLFVKFLSIPLIAQLNLNTKFLFHFS